MQESLPEGVENNERKFSHLRPGIKPIMACLDNIPRRLDFSPHSVDMSVEWSPDQEGLPNGQNLDLYGDIKKYQEEGYLKEGQEEYIISPINKDNKYSGGFFNCTGIVAVGIEEESGENVSFLSHQNPQYFLKSKKDKFITDLESRLREIKARCEDGTIDVTLFGGRYAKVRQFEEGEPGRDMFIQEYLDSIKLLAEEIFKELGFYPQVIIGPKFSPADDNIIFDTQNRRLYLTRRNNTDFVQSFNAQDIETVAKDWSPGEWGLPA